MFSTVFVVFSHFYCTFYLMSLPIGKFSIKLRLPNLSSYLLDDSVVFRCDALVDCSQLAIAWCQLSEKQVLLGERSVLPTVFQKIKIGSELAFGCPCIDWSQEPSRRRLFSDRLRVKAWRHPSEIISAIQGSDTAQPQVF